jgi:hypothetical protein
MGNSEHQNTEELEKQEIEKIKTDNLRSHPFNTKVYGENLQLPEHFLESVENNGVEEPIVINSENIVISGHRRLEAAKEVDLEEVPVRKKSYDSEEEEKEAFDETLSEIIASFYGENPSRIDQAASWVKSIVTDVESNKPPLLREWDKMLTLFDDLQAEHQDLVERVETVEDELRRAEQEHHKA